jgi:Set1/Ash2 histone methyltransferase complex subunit ASH2
MSAAGSQPEASVAAAGKSEAEGEVKANARRNSKKRGDRRVAHVDEVAAKPEDYVHLIPYKKPALDKEGWRPVALSKADRAPQLQLSEDRLSVTGHKGYRLIRATHGAHEGTWYCEATITHLGETGERFLA